jgi:hypothetical protein
MVILILLTMNESKTLTKILKEGPTLCKIKSEDMMTVQNLIDNLLDIEDKSIQVMIDVTAKDGTQIHMVACTGAIDGETPEGKPLCLLTKEDTMLFDEDDDRIN